MGLPTGGRPYQNLEQHDVAGKDQVQRSIDGVSPDNREVLFPDLYYRTRGSRSYDVSQDGERFLMIKTGDQTSEDVPAPQITVVLNWSQELLERVPVN